MRIICLSDTHRPPRGIRDWLVTKNRDRVGCVHLRERLKWLLHLRLHVFGHIHSAYGRTQFASTTTFLNASVCDESYKFANIPLSYEYTPGEEPTS